MRKFLKAVQAVVSVAAAVQLYSAILEISEGGEHIILQVTSALCMIAVAIISFAADDALKRIKNIEDAVGIYVDRGYEAESFKKECPICHREIDEEFKICPYCENRDFDSEYFHTCDNQETFNTEIADYNGTDFSGEDIVSANFDDGGE